MTDDPITRNTRELVERFWQTMNTGDGALIRAFMEESFAADVEWSVLGSGVPGAGTLKGRDQVIELISGVRTLFEPGHPRGTVIRQLVDSTWAAAETEVTGRMRDGRTYQNRYAFFIEVSGRQIRAVREYFDSHYVHELLGGKK